tara:strand:- start:6038 stop:6799 length:762 start_codon:yes stop_codon:yes gene_type:complete
MRTLPDLSCLAQSTWHASVPTGTPVDGVEATTDRAFVYVVADMRDDEDPPGGKWLLLLRHKFPRGAFGVPGGLQDKDDKDQDHPDLSLVATAKREFAEEVLGIEMPKNTTREQKAAVRDFVAMTDLDNLEELRTIRDGANQHAVAWYRMRVQRTSAFERLAAKWNLMFNPDARVDTKRVTFLSTEMHGYAWVSFDAVNEATRNPVLDHWGNLQMRDADGHTLSVRDGVFGVYDSTSNRWTRHPQSFFDQLYAT